MKWILPFVWCVIFLSGCSPLHYSVNHNNLLGVKKAIEKGESVNKSDLGWTPLMLATYHGHTAIAEYLIKEGADLNIQKRSQTGSTKFEGCTALHLAAFYGRYEIAKMLIDNGAQVSIQDNQGFTAYDYARRYEFIEIKKLIKPEAENK